MSGSAAQTTILREFLISLGFQVNKQQSADFEKTIASVGVSVTKLALAAAAAATAVYAATYKMADGLEHLYFASQRTGATADSIKAIGYAASQMGSSVQDAASSLENLAQRLRTNPGYGALANSLLGGKANLQDASVLQGQLAEKFKTMPYYLANAYASALGISETTLRAMLAGMGRFEQDYRNKLNIFGLSQDAAAVSGRRFMLAARGVGASIEILATKLGAPLADRFSLALAGFDKYLMDNSGQITRVLTKIVDGIMLFADIIDRAWLRIGQSFDALQNWFKSLSPSTQWLIEEFAAIVVAWKLMNTAFLTSPLGMLLSMIAAFGLLIDDYLTWKDKGKSLIDWSKWEPGIQQAEKAFKNLKDWLAGLDISREQVQIGLTILLEFMVARWAIGMVGAIARVALSFLGLNVAAATAGTTMALTGGGLLGFLGRAALLARRVGPWAAFIAAMWPTATSADDTMTSYNKTHPGNGVADSAGRISSNITANRDLPIEARAFLDTLAGPESGGAYNVRWAGTGKSDATFSDFSKHPRIMEPGPSGPSSAAGRYQVTASTFDDFSNRSGVTDMQPANQDTMGWTIASATYKDRTGGDLLTDLRNPAMHDRIASALKGRWPTINMKPYVSNLALEGTTGTMSGMPPLTPSGPLTPEQSRGQARLNFIKNGGMPEGGVPLGGDNIGGANITQNTTINVNGAGDPSLVAGHVVNRLAQSNADLTRNTQGAVR